MMGIFRSPANGSHYLCERRLVVKNASTADVGFEWRTYEDYTDPIPLPRYLQFLNFGEVVALSALTAEYDMVSDDGFKNIGTWIDNAAVMVGR